MRIFYYTFGCKVNQYETENIRERFESRGDVTVDTPEKADICFVNSCTVTSEADKKCRQYLHRIRKLNPECVLICAGCMTQAHEGIEEALGCCDMIIGTSNKSRIPELTDIYLKTRERIVAVSSEPDTSGFEPMCNRSANGKTRAYIKIQDGCDMHCTYCIIPKARGHIRSKAIDDIISEAEQLIASGHKELILTGINLCCYGREKGGTLRLVDAIEAVCRSEGDFRVRLSSLEPELISDSDIERMAALPKLCPQFHLSLQSGCDKTLKAMNRRYTAADFKKLCNKLRSAFPCCAITTDIMVGFPGETEQDHRESLAFAEDIGFAEAHVFQFSPRPDTPAYDMTQIDGTTKKRRATEMSAVCSKSRAEYLKGLVGTVQEVLFERESDPEYHQGHSPNHAVVKVKRMTDLSLRRQLLSVKILSTSDDFCFGELI